MSDTKVLVVDDSRMMRTMISLALEELPNISVVGEADSADDAREQAASLRPDVITLDVEMPGMSGIEYLEEIMSTRPMPVIMFSTRTSKGAADTVEALRLGAVGCFPKPVGSRDVMQETIAEVGECIKRALSVRLSKLSKQDDGPAPARPPLEWNGRPLAVGADSTSISELFSLFSGFGDDCPPTAVVLQNVDQDVLEGVVAKLDGQLGAKVVIAEDGMAMESGTIYFAPRTEHHLVVGGWPEGRLQLLARDPVAGQRPAISLLFASTAKAAGDGAVGLVVTSLGEDAARGAGVLSDARSHVIAVDENGEYNLSRGHASQPVARESLASELLKLISK
ncbi:response regulator [Erythrobacter sp. 3-20A1M]|uniref:response regulator n=1 Tax=Erythrobacter sp. 3-20A1M TaxID=2653850 RepID=UPI001BFC475C|nr:response regulator [Erythrobacter sp. 3-20A1M]QWC55980.1 response regulator [Erythrobacter sp. 3-20A1M]